jgi:hypothetical protein
LDKGLQIFEQQLPFVLWQLVYQGESSRQEVVWLGGAKVAVLWTAFPDLHLSSSLLDNIISAFVDSV